MNRNILKWGLATLSVTAVAVNAQQSPPRRAGGPPATTTRPSPAVAPVTQPASAPRTLRRPAQAEIIENLLRERDQDTLISPQDPDSPSTAPARAESGGLLLEGTVLVERPGQLVRDGGATKFVFLVTSGESQMQAMEVLPSQLLEAMEREADRGFTSFTLSARVTRYHGKNYILPIKVLRRVEHGNIAP